MSSKKIHQGHKARQRFGQNFLIDQDLITSIAQSAQPRPEDHIIEIGPGLGAITDALADSGAHMTLIELDRDLVARLEGKYADARQKGQLHIESADILKINLDEIAARHPNKQTKIIGNLPYNISTPVLFHLLQHKTVFQSMTFMLQKEVVDRISAAPATSAYSALSVILQLECHIEKLFDVPPESFQPAPKVHSAVVQLRPKTQISITHDQRPAFRHFVHQCFQQRRKTLKNNLKDLVTVAQIESLGINAQLRPEHLTLADYLLLFTLDPSSL